MTYSKEYYKKNRRKIMDDNIRWQKNNPDKVKIILKRGMAKYIKTPKGIYRTLKHNALRKNREFLSQDEFINWYVNQEQSCCYCGIKPSGKRLSIDRIDNAQGYIIENLALACDDCNTVKGYTLTAEEMKIVGKIVMEKRWKKSV
jgi:5-methylcytosine-specific restriction endonuclease McrA